MEKTNVSLIPTLYAENVDEFLNLLSKRNEIWHEASLKENLWVYRGQWEEEGKTFSLMPSSLRKNKSYQWVKQKILMENKVTGYAIDVMAKNVTKYLKSESRNKKNRERYKSQYGFYSEKMDENTRKNLENILIQSLIELTLLQRDRRTMVRGISAF